MKTMLQGKNDRWPIIRLRWGRILALIIALPLFLAYVGSYAYLSRRGMREAEKSGLKFFFYVPLDDPALRRNDLRKQGQLVTLFSPLNWIDRTFFGGTHPCTGVTLTLAGKPAEEQVVIKP